MKKIIISVFIFVTLCGSQNEKIINEFSHHLVEIISKKNLDELNKLQIYPEKRVIDSSSVNYLIGKYNSFNLPNLMKKKSLKVKLKKTKSGDSLDVFSVIFYDSKILTLNKNGFLDIEENKLDEFWGKNYVATELVIQDGNVYFYHTPFFYETDF